MSGRLKDKKIVVTAAGQGIGKATAIAFHNEGANVFATDINQDTLDVLKKDYPKIDVFKLDSTDKESVENYFKHLNNIDVLFNAVGFVHHGNILECANSYNTHLPISNLVKEMYKTLVENGHGETDHSSLYKEIERINKK